MGEERDELGRRKEGGRMGGVRRRTVVGNEDSRRGERIGRIWMTDSERA